MSVPITFVTCVESGPLESQVVRMVESLRRFGGSYADCAVWAIKPRFGPPIGRRTRQAFDRLNVEFRSTARADGFGWYPFLNKTRAVVYGAEHAATEFVGWLDADLLFTGEPTELCPTAGDDVVACSPDNCGGSTGPGDANEPYWREACTVNGFDADRLPWVTTEREGDRIRLYWNGGIVTFRRSTGFAQEYEACTVRLLDAKLASAVTGVFFLEQSSIGIAAAKLGLRTRQLPHSHNYEMGSAIHDRWYSEDKLRTAKIVHYHDSLWPAFWPTFVGCLKETHPDVATWLEPLGPLANEAPGPYRVLGKALKKLRSRGEAKFKAVCRFV